MTRRRTIDVSGTPALVFQYLLGGFVALGALVFAGGISWGLLDSAGVSVPVPTGATFVTVAAVLWATVTVLWNRRVRRSDGEWWGPVPRSQYLGRFAGRGGLARYHWERAVSRLPDDDED